MNRSQLGRSGILNRSRLGYGFTSPIDNKSNKKVTENTKIKGQIIMIIKALVNFGSYSSRKRANQLAYKLCQKKQNDSASKISTVNESNAKVQKDKCTDFDLELAKFYRDILEKQRLRMDENQKRIQDMLERERQRADKKQEESQDQLKQFLKSIQTLIGVGGLMGLIYYIFTVVNAGGDAFEKLKKYWDEGYSKYELVDKYSLNEEKIPKYYLEGNSIQQELSKIEYDGIIGLSYIVGIPGSGKTTALKKVINNLRRKIKLGESDHWQKIYYVNLRVDDENGKILLEKTKERIDQMTKLLQVIFSRKQNYLNALIVIDDIQMLQRVLSEAETKQILQSILFKCQMESCKFVIMSSSSLSYYRALSIINFRKSAYISQLQNLKQGQMRKAIQNRVKYEKQANHIEIPQKIVKYMYQYDSIKNIMNSINLVTNQYRISRWKNSQVKEEKLLEKLEDNDSNKIWDMKIDMIKMLREKSQVLGTQAVAEIIKCILKLPAEVKLGHKFTVIDQVVSKFPELQNRLDEISNVIDELDKKNILIFGHARSKSEKKALEEVLKGLT